MIQNRNTQGETADRIRMEDDKRRTRAIASQGDRLARMASDSHGSARDLKTLKGQMREGIHTLSVHDKKIRALEDEAVVKPVTVFDAPARPVFSSGARAVFPGLFDLYDITTTTVKVRGLATLPSGFRKPSVVAGIHLAVSAGTSGATLDSAITIGANTLIYLKIRKNATTEGATLETATALADGDDDDEPYDLWYVPWDTDHIVTSGIFNMQGMPRWMGFRWKTPLNTYDLFQFKADGTLGFDDGRFKP